MAVVANFPEDSLAIHLLLEASESLLNGLALLQFDLGHAASLPFRTLVGVTTFWEMTAATQVKMGSQPRGGHPGCQCVWQFSSDFHPLPAELLPCYGSGASALLRAVLLSAPTAIPTPRPGANVVPESASGTPPSAGTALQAASSETPPHEAFSEGWHRPGIAEIWRRPLPRLPRWLSRFLLRLIYGVLRRDIVNVHGLQYLRPNQDPFIVTMNHSTRLEALLFPILFAFERRGKLVRFIADWNFALIPGIATVLRAGETILLVRKPAKPAFLNVFRPWFERNGPAFERAAEVLRSGTPVGIFPEGTTNRHPTRLLRGFDGAARLSLETGAPVVPVGVRFPQQVAHQPIRDRSPMEIFIGQPLYPPQHGPAPSRDDVRTWHARIMQEIARLSGKSWDAGSTRRKHHGFE